MLAMISKGIICSLALVCCSAQATSPLVVVRVRELHISFAEASTRLSAAQRAQIDEQVEWVKGCSGWPGGGSAIVWYRLAAFSLPRNDYQMIGRRIEDLSDYLLSHHGFPNLEAGIRIGEYEGEYPGAENYREVVESRVDLMFECRG